MSAAMKSLEIIKEKGPEMRKKLSENISYLRKKINENLLKFYHLGGNVLAPIIHLTPVEQLSRQESLEKLERVASICVEQGVIVTTTKYVPLDFSPPFPSLRLTLTSQHTLQMVDTIIDVLLNASQQVFN